MKRNMLNLCVDLLAATFLLLMVTTGYILSFPLPPGSNRTRELWGLARHDWGTIHAWASLGLLIVLLVHVLLHWKWIITMVQRRCSSENDLIPVRPVRAGIMTGATLLLIGGLFAWFAQSGVRERDVPLHPLEKTPASSVPMIKREVKRVDFEKDIKPIFNVSCLSCHGADRASAHFRVDQKEHFFSSRNGSPLIVAGNPDASRLLAIVSGKAKNMKNVAVHQLKPDEIELIKIWISTGAEWPTS